jgi:hypothetical protein
MQSQYEVVLSIINLEHGDELHAFQSELSQAFHRAGMKNIPNKLTQEGDKGLIQFYMKEEDFDEMFIDELSKAILEDKYLNVSFGKK